MENPISVYQEFRSLIPRDFIDRTTDKETYLIVWLDKRMHYGITGQDEIDLIRWFYPNIEKVEIKKDDDIPEAYSPAKVTITFKDPAYFKIRKKEPATVSGPQPDFIIKFNSLAPDDQDEVLAIIEMKLAKKNKAP